MPTPTQLLQSNAVVVLDHRCSTGKSGCGCITADAISHITLVRRGCFKAHVSGREWLVSPASAFVYRAWTEYQTSHPGESGDDCTVLGLSESTFDEVFGREDLALGLSEIAMPVSVQRQHAVVFARLTLPDWDQLGGEEAVLALLAAIARSGSQGRRDDSNSDGARRTVARAREMIHAHLGRNLSIEAVARSCGCSPFHLMRLFRQVMGRSIRAYRQEIRVAEACHRVACEDAPLTDIALACGFSSHSHMTDAMKQIYGIPPTAIRADRTASPA